MLPLARNPSSEEAEAGGSGAQGHLGLSETLSYQKKKNKNKEKEKEKETGGNGKAIAEQSLGPPLGCFHSVVFYLKLVRAIDWLQGTPVNTE